MQTCAQYLVGQQPNGPFRIYHQSFRDFLLDDKEYQVYPAEANQTIADFFLKEHTDNWLIRSENYALQYTPIHLMEAIQLFEQRPEQQKLMNDLNALLTDLNFLEAKTARLGVDAVLIDLRTALNLVPSQRELSDLPFLLDILDRESHTLRGWNQEQYPILFAQQVYNRALDMELSHLAKKAATRLAQLKRPYLELLWREGPQSLVLERTLTGHEDSIRAVAVTPDGRLAISGSEDHTLRVWDLQTGQLLRTLTGHEDGVTAVAITPDGRLAVSFSREVTGAMGSVGKPLRLWNLQTGQEETPVPLLSGPSCIALTPHENIILVGDGIGNIYCLRYVNPNAP